MAEKTKKHTWEFTRYFRAGVYKWNGTALASKRIKAAVGEINNVAKKDSVLAAEGAVKFIEKCWRAIEQIDSSSGAIGCAVNNALYDIAGLFGSAELPVKERLKLIERIWESWQEEGYGYYDVLSELWPKLCKDHEVMTCWADEFLPVVQHVFSSTEPRGFFKGTRPCLACLFETGRYDEIIEMLKNKERLQFDYRKFEVMIAAARGNIEGALEVLDGYLYNQYTSPYAVARLGEELLIQNGRIEEAYRRYAFKTSYHATGLAMLSAMCKKYPKISPQRVLNDLIDADPGNERRYFAAARKIGMIELAIEIAEKYDVEPKTLTTASKDYAERDPDLALRFGLLALQRYADGFGYEPHYDDVQRCHDSVCAAAARAGKRDMVAEKLRILADNDKSIRKLVASAVHYGKVAASKMVAFPSRPER